MKPPRLAAALAALALALSPIGAASATPPMQPVPASDTRFRYGGRLDAADLASPVVIWEASTVAIDFDGDRASVRFSGATGQVYFDATVDGKSTILALKEGSHDTTLPLEVSGTGRHHLVLFKRSEASAGTVHFEGIDISPGAAVYSPPLPAFMMKMEFIGDSITAGACDEDGAEDQWESRRTHNAAYSWAAVTAAAFSADYRNISISGIGLAAGYDDVLMGQVWDRTYPSASSAKADLTQWTPDVVLVLLGDNDDSYPRSHSLPFPTQFGEKYAALVHAIRTAYPKASIVLLNGAMWAGIHSKELETAWGAVVAKLESQDAGIRHYTFAHWTMNHPRVADHRALADEVDTWLGSQAFMRAASGAGRQTP